MTGAEVAIYTAAVALSTTGIMATIAGWVIQQPMIEGANLTAVLGSAFAAWLVFGIKTANSRHAAKQAERKRCARAVEYTRLGQRR